MYQNFYLFLITTNLWLVHKNPSNPIFYNSVIPQAISAILTIWPIFQTAINIPQTTILFPSNIIGSHHITMKHQYIMNWMGCILKPLYQWIHQVRLYHTYNLAPLTRNESTVYRHTMVTVCSSRKKKKVLERVSIHLGQGTGSPHKDWYIEK